MFYDLRRDKLKWREKLRAPKISGIKEITNKGFLFFFTVPLSILCYLPREYPKSSRFLIFARTVRALLICASRQLDFIDPRSYGQYESKIRFLLFKKDLSIVYA